MILFLIIFQVISAILLVGIILLQHGKGADIGSAFGSGSSNPMLGPIDSTNLLTKVTWVLVAIFFVVTISISIFIKNEKNNQFDFNIYKKNIHHIE